MNAFAAQRRRLSIGLAVVFGLLTMAAIFLIYFSYGQLRYEAYFVQRNLAEAFVDRVGAGLTERIVRESNRAPAEYEFLLGGSDRFSQISPLSNLPSQTDFPGTLGYFQVDAAGQFSTPLLPDEPALIGAVGFSESELNVRQQLSQDIRDVLAKNQQSATSVGRTRPSVVAGSAGEISESLSVSADLYRSDADVSANKKIFAELSKSDSAYEKDEYVSSVGRVDELKLKSERKIADAQRMRPHQPAVSQMPGAPQTAGKRQARAELIDDSAVAEPLQPKDRLTLNEEQRDSVFASSINQFRLTVLDGDYIAFHRDVWLDGERRIQGFVVRLQAFVQQVIGSQFVADQISSTNDLVVALNSEVLTLVPAQRRQVSSVDPDDVAGNEILLRRRLPAPAHDFEVIVSTRSLPAGTGFGVLAVTGAVLLLLLAVGYLMLSRLLHKSIDLAQQQQDFVSAVTHELKTPLTSIRMYGEILRAGWADEEKKRGYYDFIFHESERLSRLINNVLQLARITRGGEEETALQLRPVGELMATVKTASQGQFEASGFALEICMDDSLAESSVAVDPDGFLQVMVNLLDNALKFAGSSDRKIVVLGARKYRDCVDFYVRDFGPGVPREKMKKIFDLFYRGADEVTRETSGTGIGLALVAELVEKMSGQIDVIDRAPGAEFIVRISRVDA